ncbi:MAG TPA: hypothetical protein PKC80_07355 [Burkholderiaceae bacterium]|nr:hypothetical protein [Burkholderiaceae bacterium]
MNTPMITMHLGAPKPVPDNWRDQLASHLGQRPRRVGVWAEVALFGALECLANHGLKQLPTHAVLRVASQYGPTEAIALAWQACAENGLPMPFDFLQSQPSQMLAALSQYLKWVGDAKFISHESAALLMAQMQAEAQVLRLQAEQMQRPWFGLLFGMVDIKPVPRSQWCLLK